MMFLKHRYGLGYETLCREVADSLSWSRLARVPLGTRVPHPSTLGKITARCGPETIAALNEALLAKPARRRWCAPTRSAPTPPWWLRTWPTRPTPGC